MAWYPLILEKILLPIGDMLFGTTYILHLKKYRKWFNCNETELSSLEENHLKKVLLNAVNHSQFYQSIILQGDNPYEWLKKFPIIDKKMLNENVDTIITQPKENLIISKSSGSSGIQTTVYMNKNEVSSLRALQTLFWESAGFSLGDSIIQTGINPKRIFIKQVKDFFFRTYYFTAFNSNEQSVLKALKFAKPKKTILVGYASSLHFFAETAKKYNLNIKLKSVISLGDKLFEQYRKNIESAFNCDVFDTYGSSEGFLMGFQHDLNYMYHFNPQTFIELVDDIGNPVQDGQMGHVVVTRLDGFSMPLIRYKLGDLAIKLPRQEYPTNRKLSFPILKQIVGRNTDIIKTPGGKVLVVHFFTGIFEHFQEIKQFRVLQLKLNQLKIEIIKGANFNDLVFENLKKTVQEKVNDSKLVIEYDFVSNIPSTQSGKPEIVKTFI